jgi:hypothetical protein
MYDRTGVNGHFCSLYNIDTDDVQDCRDYSEVTPEDIPFDDEDMFDDFDD